MVEKEMQAHDMVRRRSWSRAVPLYDQILTQLSIPTAAATTTTTTATTAVSTPPSSTIATTTATTTGGAVTGSGTNTTHPVPSRSQKDRQIACLLGRCECLLELAKYESCLADARKVLTLLSEQTDCLASVSRTRRWLIHSLCKLKKYSEAEQTTREWISEISGQQSFADISKTLERYKSIMQMVNGYKSNQKISMTRLEDEMSILDTKLDHWATNNLPLDKYSKLLSNKGLKKRENNNQNQQNHNGTAGAATAPAAPPPPPPINTSGVLTSTSSNNSTASNSSSSSSISSSSSSNSISNSGSNGNHNNNNSVIVNKTADMMAAVKISGKNDSAELTCSYCAISYQNRNELQQHCQTESHQNVIMSDEGRDWRWRPPPRGFTLDLYSLCESFSESQTCHYGNQCVEAHGLDELNEWKERFDYRKMRLQKACEKELYGKSYTEEILEKWIQASSPDIVMCEKVDDIDDQCSNELVTSISSKTSKREWLFVLRTKKSLRAVALLQDAHRNHFTIKSIIPRGDDTITVDLKSNQEWVSQQFDHKLSNNESNDNSEVLEHKVAVEFQTEIYGTFRQSLCFDFGTEPLLVKHLCVDVLPVGDAEKIEEIKKDIINSSSQRWDNSNTELLKFESTMATHLKTEACMADLKHEKELLERYPCPRADTFTLTQSTIVEKRLTQNNYRSRIHELLYVEEIARYEQIARYNLRTKLTITSNYILTPAGLATSTAKYSLLGELFALMRLGKDISEDTSAGRLILSNCSSVYISAVVDSPGPTDKKRNIYEALIEDKGKNVIYLKLSSKCVEAMGLRANTDIEVDIQFQLNRLPYCEWHNAVDKITDFKIIFPCTEIEPNIPWTPKKQWSNTTGPKLNAKQREAVNAITTSSNIKLPPILLIGPFGTGKTFTLAQAIKQLLTQPTAKILICTHSNSAADLYIKEYLHPWIEEGLDDAKPLRVYYHKRWIATVNSIVQKYCITDDAGNFRRPTVEDIMNHRIVVVTLSISMELSTLGLPKGYFTHIFLDEAAQAMECEAIMPLALANDTTRIVLAGDHMQMSPELFSNFAKERKLHISLLERLYDHYPSNFLCKILLCENYRAHEAIIKFTSELFYEQKLIASGKQPRHERFYPLTFFTTRGEDVQDKNSTAFYNNSEVYEVVERVVELRKRWPSAWGKWDDTSIGIMTPYADQVFRIRSELRKRRMGGISVERVLNVQGKQFRAIFLSTVRTRLTCMTHSATSGGTAAAIPNSGNATAAVTANADDTDYGFLSNSKLLNTAITRAQSLVAVVGDPVALCSIGRCRKVWERFIDICDENKSLYGITWSSLRSQLDGVELKRGYVLNPLAPEFIPRSMQPEAYLREQAAMFMIANAVGTVAAASMGSNQLPLGMSNSNSVVVPHKANNQIPPLYPNHAAAYGGGLMAGGPPIPKPHFPYNMQHIRSMGPPMSPQTGMPQQQQPPQQPPLPHQPPPMGPMMGQFGVRPPPMPSHGGVQIPGQSKTVRFNNYVEFIKGDEAMRASRNKSYAEFMKEGLTPEQQQQQQQQQQQKSSKQQPDVVWPRRKSNAANYYAALFEHQLQNLSKQQQTPPIPTDIPRLPEDGAIQQQEQQDQQKTSKQQQQQQTADAAFLRRKLPQQQQQQQQMSFVDYLNHILEVEHQQNAAKQPGDVIHQQPLKNYVDYMKEGAIQEQQQQQINVTGMQPPVRFRNYVDFIKWDMKQKAAAQLQPNSTTTPQQAQQQQQQQQQPPPAPPPKTAMPPVQQASSATAMQPPFRFKNYEMMSWEMKQKAVQQQQQQQQQMLRASSYPDAMAIHPSQQQQQQLPQNPNVSLWGPPPQNNPWGMLPKPNPLNPNQHRSSPQSLQQSLIPQHPPQNTQSLIRSSDQLANNNNNNNNQTTQQQQTSPQQPPQLRVPPQANDLSYMKKSLYPGQQPQPPNPTHSGFNVNGIGGYNGDGNGNPAIQLLNQRNGIPNGPISPAQALIDPFMPPPPQLAGVQQQPQQLPPHQSNFLMGNMGNKDKEFQFLNNVHVPLNVGGTMFQAAAAAAAAAAPPQSIGVNTAGKLQSPTGSAMPVGGRFQDYNSLLPPNMSIYEMAFEPKESQYKWYLKLMELHGQDAANKFTEILRQVIGMMQQQHNPHINPQAQMQPNFGMYNAAMQQQQQLQQTRMGNSFLAPPPTMQQHNQQLQQQQPQHLLNHIDETTQQVDGAINFNQQIDLVFNSLMNGNEIAQPILRDLFGIGGNVGGGVGVAGNCNVNGSVSGNSNADVMLSSSGGGQQQTAHSKGFPLMATAATMQQHQQQQQQKPAMFPTLIPQPQSAFIPNSSLLGNENLFGGNNESNLLSGRVDSVPLYRRQAINNGSNLSPSTGMNSSTPDNMSEADVVGGGGGGSVGVGNATALGLGISGTGNLIESIFNQKTNEITQTTAAYHQQQKLLFNNYPFKSQSNDLDMFMRIDHGAVPNDGHQQGFAKHQQQQQQQQQHPNTNHSQPQVHHHPQPPQQQHHHLANMQPISPGSGGENRNTTYAAVLSQGPVNLPHSAANAVAVGHHPQQQQQQHIHPNATTTQQQFFNPTSNTVPPSAGGDDHQHHSQQHQHHHHHHHHSQQQHQHHNNQQQQQQLVTLEKDPFAAIRELGQGTNGLYNYFQ